MTTCMLFLYPAKLHGVPSDEDISMISWRAAHRWRQGLELGVDPAEFDQISSECGSDQSLCSVSGPLEK